MAEFNVSPPPSDFDLVEDDKRKWKEQLEAQKAKSMSMYHELYQRYLEGLKKPRTGEMPTTSFPGEISDLMAPVRKAYAKAYADGLTIRGFQEGLSRELPQQKAEAEEKPRPSSKLIQSWMALAERNPEKAKVLLDSLTDEQLSKLAYMDMGGETNFPLLAMMGNPKSSVSDMISVINAMPKQPEIKDYFDTALKLAEKLEEKNAKPEEGETVKYLKEQMATLTESYKSLEDRLHQQELDRRDDEIKSLRGQLTDLEKKILTPEEMIDKAIAHEERLKSWAKERGYVKEGQSDRAAERAEAREDLEFFRDTLLEVTDRFDPLIDAYSKRVEARIRGEALPGAKISTRIMRCPNQGCRGVLQVPWDPLKKEPVDGWQDVCPSCKKMIKKKSAGSAEKTSA